jgi:hypothetical protein
MQAEGNVEAWEVQLEKFLALSDAVNELEPSEADLVLVDPTLLGNTIRAECQVALNFTNCRKESVLPITAIKRENQKVVEACTAVHQMCCNSI